MVKMKKYGWFILLISGFWCGFEQTKTTPNLWITIVSFVVFMFTMMQLSAKIPPKNQDNDNNKFS